MLCWLQVSDSYFLGRESLHFTVLYLNTMLIQFNNLLKYNDKLFIYFLGIHRAKPDRQLGLFHR